VSDTISNHNIPEETRDRLEAARSGDKQALDEIIAFYEPEIRKIACKYFLQRADYDDLIQEGRIAIYKAILSYDFKPDVPFLHFVRLVIKRKLIDSLRAHTRQKHLNLNQAYSLDNSLSDEQGDSFLAFTPTFGDPESTVVAVDEARLLVQDLSKGLSRLELLVFEHHFVAGLKQQEVMERLRLRPKSLDNAIQRIRRKTLLYRSRQVAG